MSKDINNSLLIKGDHVAFATREGNAAVLKQGLVVHDKYDRTDTVTIQVHNQRRVSRVNRDKVIKMTA
jgi:hypothetical protein